MGNAKRQRTLVLTGASRGIGHATPGTERIIETLPLAVRASRARSRT